MLPLNCLRLLLLLLSVGSPAFAIAQAPTPPKLWKLSLQSRVETGPASGRWTPRSQSFEWNSTRTAVIVCDVWDYHHSINAVRRLNEMAPRLNAFIAKARAEGATIIHAPSDCMARYEQDPARLRAIELAAKVTDQPPPQADDWNHCLPAEKNATYPVDQSDGGEDDDPTEHAAWARQLEALGRNPAAPWKAQSPSIEIKTESDLITDKGSEIWKILHSRGIEQVLLVGVHTNMCVIGRPFGLRQLVSWGKRAALVADLTDTMYNPQRWPFVSHFAGTDLVVEYIQQHVCPTITSDQLLGGQPFRFAGDKRPTLAMLISEDEYETRSSLPAFAEQQKLRNHFRLQIMYGQDQAPHQFVDVNPLEQADLLLVSVRRLPLSGEQLAAIKNYVSRGKPVLGIRTANHAFAPRDGQPPEGWQWWPEFDAQVFGGNYSGHLGNELQPLVSPIPNRSGGDHPLLAGCDFAAFQSSGSLYRTTPLSSSTDAFLQGAVTGQPAEPLAWTFVRADGGRSFYTSLGHPEDFKQPAFQQLLLNACLWGAGLPLMPIPATAAETSGFWRTLKLPDTTNQFVAPGAGEPGLLWCRCLIKFRRGAPEGDGSLNLGGLSSATKVWLNGQPLSVEDNKVVRIAKIPPDLWSRDDGNQLVLGIAANEFPQLKSLIPTLAIGPIGWRLDGNWQTRWGQATDPLQSLPLPPRFGGSANIVFEF